MHGIAESVRRKHQWDNWTTTIGSNTIFANNGITRFVQMLTLLVTSTDSLNAERNIKSHKSHKVVQQSFGQLLRYLVLFIMYRYYTNKFCIQWIQHGWFCKDILHQQPGI